MDLKQLLSGSYYHLTGSLGEEHYDGIVDCIAATEQGENITILLNSPGGSLSVMFAIHDLLRLAQASGLQVTMLASGRCRSAATILQTAVPLECRAATRETRYLFHPPSVVLDDKLIVCPPASRRGFRFRKRSAAIDETYLIQDRLIELMTDHTDLSREEVIELFSGTNYRSAEEVKKFGLISEIL